jgi:hypothetical protein
MYYTLRGEYQEMKQAGVDHCLRENCSCCVSKDI